MASSGSFNTSAYSDRYLTFSWSIKSQSIANNETVINWSLKGAGGSTTRWYTSGNFKVVINGVTVYSSSTRIDLYNGTTVASGTATIKHNNDGTKTFSASAEAGIYTVAVNVRGSGSWALTNIPRYATVNQSLTSKTETTATIKWTSDATVDYIWYSSNNGSSWTGINVADGTSGSYTISGLSANTTYQVKTRVRRKDSQLTTDSSALSVTTYAYPYANSMPNFTIGSKVTLGIYNPLGRSVTVNILGADNSQISNDTTSGTSISGYNGDVVVNRLYASIPNAKSGTYKVKVTYGSQVTTKTGGTYTVNENVCKPSITSVAYKDTNSKAVGITGNNQQIVRNQSTVQYTASGLTAQKSATVKSCNVVVNGNTYNLTLSGSSATGGNAKIDSGTDVSAVFTVTDSRGLTASKSITVKMLDWSVPSAIITLQRQDNFYTNTNLNVDADYPSINGNNRITITYQATKDGDSSPSVTGSVQDNVTKVVALDNNYAWTVKVTLVDSFGGTTTYTAYISRGMPIIYFDRLKSSVGVNCFPQEEKTLEVNGKNVENFNADTIAKNTDFNNIKTPRYYVGNASQGAYKNCPVSAGTFTMTVVQAGSEGQLMQKLVTCNKTTPTTYIRHFYSNSWGNWINDSANTVDSRILTEVYPVGAIYISVNNTNPSTIFGGTWSQIKDKFLLSAGDSYTAGSTGGANTHSHKYCVDYRGYHGEVVNKGADGGGIHVYDYSNGKYADATQDGTESTWVNSALNGGEKQVTVNKFYSEGRTNNGSSLPPYLTVYMWQRTA